MSNVCFAESDKSFLDLTGVSDRVKTIEDSYVKTITIDNSETNHVTATKGDNSYAINFDAMVIDCGEY